MKNKLKLGMCSAVLIGSLVGGSLATSASSHDVNHKVAQQSVSQFKDVAANHYAYEAIEWAKNNGIVSGYTDSKGNPNGMFGPSDHVTEAQFVKMVSHYFGLKDDAGNIEKKGTSKGISHWSDTNYDALAKHGVPLNGYFDNNVRNQPVKRGTVAQVLGYLINDTSSLTGSINYLLNTGITTGQNPQFEGKDLNQFFGSTNNLTRSQVVAFLHRIDTKDLNKLGQGSNAYANVGHDLNSKANSASSRLDSSLSSKPSNTNNTANTVEEPKEVAEDEKVDNSKNEIVYDKETNSTTYTSSSGFSVTTSGTSVADKLPKDKNGKIIVSTDIVGTQTIQQVKPVKLDNSLTPILKEVLREGEDYKTNYEDSDFEAVYVHSKDTQRALYSVLNYNEEKAKERAFNSGSEYVLDKIYSMDIERFEKDIDLHVNNLILFGLVSENADKNELKKFIFDSSKESQWGDGIENKKLGLYGVVVIGQFIEIGKIIK